MQFTGFAAADFDAYLQRKWPSNVFNLERLQVKQKVTALGRQVASVMVAADDSPLELETSAEHPALWNQHKVTCQYLFFSRNSSARRELESTINRNRSMASMIEDPSPLRNHIFLSIMIDAAQVELALKLHSDATVDRENLQRKCQDFFHRERLLNLLLGLPEPFQAGIAGRPLRSACTLDDQMLQEVVRDLPGAQSWFVVSRSFARDEPLVATEAFAEEAAQVLMQLRPVLHHVAWTRDNDFVAMSDALRSQEARQKSKGLAKNDRVRVVRGMFSGKTGVVQSIDAKGALKVMLGTMAVKLGGEDVVKI